MRYAACERACCTEHFYHWSELASHKPAPQVREGLHYNPYFPGGAIAMPKMLNDG